MIWQGDKWEEDYDQKYGSFNLFDFITGFIFGAAVGITLWEIFMRWVGSL